MRSRYRKYHQRMWTQWGRWKLHRSHWSWYGDYMHELGLMIGGGTSQIQKNIIAERGLGLPRERKL